MNNNNLIDVKRHEAEVYRLVECLSHNIDPIEGAEYTVDCRLGTEGPDSWSRWKFDATPELISEAEQIFLAK